MTDTAEIAQEFCNQIFRKLSPHEIPAVTNAPQLKRHLIPLRQQTPNLALILYNGNPEPPLLKFCRQIADILPIAWITDSPLEPPLRGFPPQQPNYQKLIDELDELYCLKGYEQALTETEAEIASDDYMTLDDYLASREDKNERFILLATILCQFLCQPKKNIPIATVSKLKPISSSLKPDSDRLLRIAIAF